MTLTPSVCYSFHFQSEAKTKSKIVLVGFGLLVHISVLLHITGLVLRRCIEKGDKIIMGKRGTQTDFPMQQIQ
jgi:hypothetical protein